MGREVQGVGESKVVLQPLAPWALLACLPRLLTATNLALLKCILMPFALPCLSRVLSGGLDPQPGNTASLWAGSGVRMGSRERL